MVELSQTAPIHGGDSEVTIGEMRLQTMPPITYLYASKQTTMEALRADIDEFMAKTAAAQQAAPGMVAGPYLFVYIMDADMSRFEMRIGFPVVVGTRAPEGLQVAELGEFRCASLVYGGGLQHMTRAWNELMEAMKQQGLTPRNETREWYLYFENDGSPNNVTMLQQAI